MKLSARLTFLLSNDGRDGLKAIRRFLASIDDRLSARKPFSTDDGPFDAVSRVRVGHGESVAAERFCNLMSI